MGHAHDYPEAAWPATSLPLLALVGYVVVEEMHVVLLVPSVREPSLGLLPSSDEYGGMLVVHVPARHALL